MPRSAAMTPRQARAMFAYERRRFAALFPRVAGARLVLAASRCPLGEGRVCRTRDVALADRSAHAVVLVTRALRWSRDNVRGLLRHELGHLADPWPEAPGREQRADDIAEMCSGQRVRYDARRVQTTGAGVYPRPRSLHR